MSSNREWYANYIYQPTDRFAGLPDDLAAMVKGELTEGEQILWLEQPSFSSYVQIGIWWLAFCPAISIIGTLFSQLLVYGNFDHLSFFSFWPALFYPVVILVTSLWITSKMIKKMVYVVTNRRAMVINNWLGGAGKIKSYYLQHQIHKTNFKVKKRKDGSGNFYFTSERTPLGNSRAPMGFIGIKAVDRVQEILESYLDSTSENALDELPAGLQKAVRSELGENENLLWMGQPGTYTIQQRNETQRKLILAGGIIAGFAFAIGFLLLNGLIIKSGSIQLMLLEIGGVFLFEVVLLGYILFSKKRNNDRYQNDLNTVYVLTDQRMIKIKVDNRGQEKLETYEFASRNDTSQVKRATHLDKITDLSLVQSEDGQHFETKISLDDVLEGDKVARLIEQQLATTVSI